MEKRYIPNILERVQCMNNECLCQWGIENFKIIRESKTGERLSESKLKEWKKEGKWWICPYGCNSDGKHIEILLLK
ncbi:MAG: hypothetical protein SVV67_10555 [Bacillota bacterium]|nr:hypothetical protein [Bacillota bacterium]